MPVRSNLMMDDDEDQQSDTNDNYGFPVFWVTCHGGLLPKGLNPVFGGLCVKTGEPTYVARAIHKDELIPGRFVPSTGKCYVGFCLAEHSYSQYQVLTKPPGTNLEWVPITDGLVPCGAVVGGQIFGKLFIGRVYFDGFGICGKVAREQGRIVLYIAVNGKEHRITRFEVLVISSSLKWINCENGQVPNSKLNPVMSGITSEGEPTYVGRAYHLHGQTPHLIPGRVVASQGKCYVGHCLQQHACSQYQVLTNPNGVKLEWIPAHSGHVPVGAVVGGEQYDGVKLFIGRVHHDGFGISGQVRPVQELNLLFLPTGGIEWPFHKFEVLVDTDKIATTSTTSINHGVTM